MRKEILQGKASGFMVHEDRMLRFHNQVCVPAIEELKRQNFDEGHNTPYSVHPRRNELYKELKWTFWWSNIEREVADYVPKCLTYQCVNVENQLPAIPL